MPKRTKMRKRGGSRGSNRVNRRTRSVGERNRYINEYSKSIADFCNYIEENYSDLSDSNKMIKIEDRKNLFLRKINSLNSKYSEPNRVGKVMMINVRYEVDDEVKEYIVEFDLPFDVYNELAEQLQMIGYIYDNDQHTILNIHAAAPAAG